MFHSVTGGILPTIVLSALVGVALAFLRRRWLALVIAPLAAIGLSYAWFYLPVLLWPAEHTDPQGGWDFVATAFWSLFAVPAAVAALLVAQSRLGTKPQA